LLLHVNPTVFVPQFPQAAARGLELGAQTAGRNVDLRHQQHEVVVPPTPEGVAAAATSAVIFALSESSPVLAYVKDVPDENKVTTESMVALIALTPNVLFGIWAVNWFSQWLRGGGGWFN